MLIKLWFVPKSFGVSLKSRLVVDSEFDDDDGCKVVDKCNEDLDVDTSTKEKLVFATDLVDGDNEWENVVEENSKFDMVAAGFLMVTGAALITAAN